MKKKEQCGTWIEERIQRLYTLNIEKPIMIINLYKFKIKSYIVTKRSIKSEKNE